MHGQSRASDMHGQSRASDMHGQSRASDMHGQSRASDMHGQSRTSLVHGFGTLLPLPHDTPDGQHTSELLFMVIKARPSSGMTTSSDTYVSRLKLKSLGKAASQYSFIKKLL